MIQRSIVVLVLSFFLSNCTPTEKIPEIRLDATKDSYTHIQEQIFDKSCAVSGCHLSESDPSFKQHGLVLASGVSYQNLMKAVVKQPNAFADGLKMIDVANVENSFLVHKLEVNNTSHHSNKNYGANMPLGAAALSPGKIEYIKQWIKAGAAKDGKVAELGLLTDETAVVDTWVPVPAIPKSVGYQMTIPKFEVSPNTNREFFIRQNLNNPDTIYVTNFETHMREGSHHLLVYRFENEKNLPQVGQLRDLRFYDKNGTKYYNLYSDMAITQYILLSPGGKYFKYDMPKGYALEIPANSSFDLNAHYFNTTNQTRYGEVVMNMYTTPKNKVEHICEPLDLYNYNISIPPKSRKTETEEFIFDEDTEVISLTSHAHKTMERFEIQIAGGPNNGKVLLVETDYAHPKILNFDVPLKLKKGEGLRSVVTYNNPTNRTLKFGATTEDEMNIIFGYIKKTTKNKNEK